MHAHMFRILRNYARGSLEKTQKNNMSQARNIRQRMSRAQVVFSERITGYADNALWVEEWEI